jgi:hypothetical protein
LRVVVQPRQELLSLIADQEIGENEYENQGRCAQHDDQQKVRPLRILF